MSVLLALFSALGAVLLFLLKLVGILLLIGMVLLALVPVSYTHLTLPTNREV